MDSSAVHCLAIREMETGVRCHMHAAPGVQHMNTVKKKFSLRVETLGPTFQPMCTFGVCAYAGALKTTIRLSIEI